MLATSRSWFGTGSIEKSQHLAELLLKAGFKQLDYSDPNALTDVYAAAREGRVTKRFAVLNARFHEQEAYIVAEAGVPGAITIATNMAGRGTDIKLGGNVEMRVEKELAGVAEGPEREAAIAAIKAEIEENRAKVLASGEPADPAAGRKKALPGGLYIIGTSAMNRGASTTSCAAVPAVRAIPAARSSTCRSRTT